MQQDNIFQAVQEQYNIVEVATSLGIKLRRIGSTYRANSLNGGGAGKDAFAIYERSNTWYDFMTGNGGDIVELYAQIKCNGDKHQALVELMPEWQNSSKVNEELSNREKFMEKVKFFSDKLFDTNWVPAQQAINYLHSRGITDDTIRKLQLGLETSNYEYRIRIPYWDITGKKILYSVSRVLPDYLKEGAPKYKKASLEYNPFLRNAPLGLNTVKDAEFCVITEGAFDWLNFYQKGIPCLSPNGTDFGKLWPEVIEVIKQHFSYVVLCFDNDTAGQQATVKAAEVLLKAEIPFNVAQIINVKDVAEVCESGDDIMNFIYNAENGLKWYAKYLRPAKDFDCLTIEQRQEALKKCRDFVLNICSYTSNADIQEILLNLKGYFPKEWFSSLCKCAVKGLTEHDVCEKIVEKHRLLFNEKLGFYEFTQNGIWEAQTDTTIKSYIKDAYGINATGAKLAHTINLLKAHNLVNSEKLMYEMDKKCCVSFYNGTLHINLKTGSIEFRKHSPDDFVTVRLPYFYHPDAKSKKWEDFIEDVTGKEKSYQLVLQEFAGYVLYPNCKWQTALMLKGGGSNGKSVFTSIIAKVYGDRGEACHGYVSYAEPAKFAKDFRQMAFRTSWLNISSDVENDMNGGEGVFKKIVRGEILEDSYKHKDPFPFRTRTKLMMCSNYFPTTRDTSTGFLRSWLIVPFTQRYVVKGREKANDKIIDPNLEEKLSRELSGIFNWCLEGLLRLIKQNQFTELKDSTSAVYEFAKANNPLYCFVEDKIGTLREKTKQHRTNIYSTYKSWAENSGVLPLAANRFYSNFKSVLEAYGIKVTEHGRYWTIETNSVLIEAEKEDEKVEAEINKEYEDNVKAHTLVKDVMRFYKNIRENGDYTDSQEDFSQMILKHFMKWLGYDDDKK